MEGTTADDMMADHLVGIVVVAVAAVMEVRVENLSRLHCLGIGCNKGQR